jgi:predicted  nucleic acid-binding Zn-ribbon protein
LGNNLKFLAELQAIDLKLDAFQNEKLGFQKELLALDEKLGAARDAVSLKQDELNGIEKEKTELEDNLASESDSIIRSETRLKEIKTQKEYQAVSKEISAAKKIKAELEEQLLQKIARIDELKAEVNAMESDLTVLEENINSQKSEVHGKIEELEKSSSTDIAERESLVKSIQPALLNRYTMLRERRQGLAVVEARNGSCLGCNMNLPPQVYNNLFNAENLISCPHCQRLLYLRQRDEVIN